MNGLERRLAALEELAEGVRLRPYRELAAEAGEPLERFLQRVEQCRAERDRLRARGMTEQEIFEATATRMGITAQELRRRCEQLIERFG